MKSGCSTVILLGGGVILFWLITLAVQSFAGEGPDRSNVVQVPLFLVLLAAPVISAIFRRRVIQLPIILLVVQLFLYVAYETGVSLQSNIRADLLLVYPAVVVNAWMALHAIKSGADDAESEGKENAVPTDRTVCDECGVGYPSHYYLEAAGDRGYICKNCQAKP